MASLLDVIRNGTAAVPTPGATDETARLADMMRAKSGRALPGSSSTPRMSNLQEQSSNALAAGTAAVQKQDAAIQTAGVEAGLAGAETKTATHLNSISADRAAQKQGYADKTASLLQELTQGLESGKLDRSKARREELGFLSRLQSEAYVQELQQVAAEARLDSELGFRDAMMQDVFKAELGLLRESLNYNELLAADANKFNEMIGNMDIGFAMQIANANAAAANSQAVYTSAGNLVTAGAGAAVDYEANQEKQKKPPT